MTVTARAVEQARGGVRAESRRRLIVVAAPMRSGHHAVVLWVLAALDARRTTFQRRPGHWNDADPFDDGRWRRGLAGRIRIVRAEALRDLVVNYEDRSLAVLEGVRPGGRTPDRLVHVERSLLNLVASRLQYRRTRPNGEVLMPLDRDWLTTEVTNRATRSRDWTVVRFDDWLVDASHRAEILGALDLPVVDRPLDVSRDGGGSSFTGLTRTPTAEALRHRYRDVVWEPGIVELVRETVPVGLLTTEERDFLSTL